MLRLLGVVVSMGTLKFANELRAGDKFIFGEDLGGEGEVLTVDSSVTYYGTTYVGTEELDFTIDMVGAQPVEVLDHGSD